MQTCLICCPLHVDAPDQVTDALDRARRATAAGARLIEWRVDLLAEEDHDVALRCIRALVADSPAPCIVTIRPSWEGGLYGGSETDRVSLLEAIGAGDVAPRYIDVELDAYRTSRNRRQKFNLAVDHDAQPRDVTPRLILSTHDFTKRPDDLLQRGAAMASEPACAVMKFAWHARSLRDNLEAFDLLAERVKPTVALCMGEFGLLSRVLAPKFGGLFTFAALERGAESAPGQPTIDDLRTRYRFDAIGRATKVYGVIGWPVGHSKSPVVHNAGFAALDVDGVYLPLPVPAEWEHFKATVGALVDHGRLDFRGASVTVPHKEHLVRFVRERGGAVSGLADALGAANTLIVAEDRSLRCANTDAAAAAQALASARGGTLVGARVAILGAGGVARAVAGAVALAGGHATLVARDHAKALRVAGEIAERASRVDVASLDACERPATPATFGSIDAVRADTLGCGCFDAFVNATPVGMVGGPEPDGDPVASVALGADVEPNYDGVVVFDTVYAPQWTPWLRVARDRGATCLTGVDMFLAQAERQFEAWTGVAPPVGLFAAELQRSTRS
ncbi:MAG: type I 3-dehydroquinate dehydratase [Phycisphaerae bacterium]|nr:type I 3-dehydroquinate dehydratase [Phycisphaerae bacterium]